MAVLDIMMPGMSGIEVLKKIRKEGNKIPILLLTAMGEVEDRIDGLDAGADDYLPKPFNTEELLARVRALGRRRGEVVEASALGFGGTSFDAQNLKLRHGAEEISLTRKEGELLEYLMLNKNIITSKEQIIEKLWGFDSEAEANHVEVYVSFLRKKLKRINADIGITAVRGVGYKLEEL